MKYKNKNNYNNFLSFSNIYKHKSNKYDSYIASHNKIKQNNDNLQKSNEEVKNNNNSSRTNVLVETTNNLTDAEGLDKAREQDNRIYVNKNTMYISGTAWKDKKTGRLSLQDPWDDLKIPTFQTRYTQRYKDAEEMLMKYPNIDRFVGHSLGGSVALELGDKYKKQTTTYMAPVIDTGLFNNIQPDRYRNEYDPISMFDRGAKAFNYRPDIQNKWIGKIANVGTALITGRDEPAKFAEDAVNKMITTWATHADYHSINPATNSLSNRYIM